MPRLQKAITTREKAVANDREWDRRSLLRGAAVVAGAAATVPLLGGATAAQADSSPADALFKAGKFEQAGRAYKEILRKDPENLQAARQLGYVRLLSNNFPDAEKYLTMALELAPGDKETSQILGDCYIRQDKLSLYVPRWQAAGYETYARWFAAVHGRPYQIHGDTARLPWQQMDPEPQVEASVNGGPPKLFTFYTGASWLGMSSEVAREAGLKPVTRQEIPYLDGTIWQYFGVLDSFKLGGIELRNVPVEWDESAPDSPGGPDDGIIGTWIFYHFLTTFEPLHRPRQGHLTTACTGAMGNYLKPPPHTDEPGRCPGRRFPRGPALPCLRATDAEALRDSAASALGPSGFLEFVQFAVTGPGSGYVVLTACPRSPASPSAPPWPVPLSPPPPKPSPYGSSASTTTDQANL